MSVRRLVIALLPQAVLGFAVATFKGLATAIEVAALAYVIPFLVVGIYNHGLTGRSGRRTKQV